MADPDLNIKDVSDALDSFYCHNVIVSLWADAMANRLEGLAIYLLSDELPEVAEHARKAAARLADRIGDLGGAITADPRHLLDRAPGNYEFTIPDCSDPRAITSYALQRLDVIIDEPARIRYHQGGTLLFESQAPPGPRPGVRVRWMEPEGPHSVENTGQHRYRAIRVELK